jgi:hypothetical protein
VNYLRCNNMSALGQPQKTPRASEVKQKSIAEFLIAKLSQQTNIKAPAEHGKSALQCLR